MCRFVPGSCIKTRYVIDHCLHLTQRERPRAVRRLWLPPNKESRQHSATAYGTTLFEEGAADCALDPEGGHNITVLTRFQ